MNIPDLTDGFIAWQSTLPCRTNQKTPFVDERVFQNHGICGQAFPFLPSPPPSRTFVRSLQFSRVPKSEKCFKPAESPTETLATQASRSITLDLQLHKFHDGFHSEFKENIFYRNKKGLGLPAKLL